MSTATNESEATMENPILIGYDGSDAGRHAIAYAGRLFAGRRTLILGVWEGWPPVVRHRDEENVAVDDETREAVEAMAHEGVELARAAGLVAEGRTRYSSRPTWEQLVDAADENDAALLLLGSRGLSGLRSLMLGSVSHQVAHHAHVPVLVVPSPELTEARHEQAAGRPDGAGTAPAAPSAAGVTV